MDSTPPTRPALFLQAELLEDAHYRDELLAAGETLQSPAIRFTCHANGLGGAANWLLFDFDLDAGTTNWGRLAEAAESGRAAHFDWKPGNGQCKIAIHPATDVTPCRAEFTLEKAGSGAAGCMVFNLPAQDCVTAFRTAENFTEEWLDVLGGAV